MSAERAIAPHDTALIELGLPYELIVIDLMTGAQHSPDYLALNPGAKTPTLVDGDLAIFESNAILLYLATMVVVVNFIVDVLYAVIDPRVKASDV